jgi:hypothetical protein
MKAFTGHGYGQLAPLTSLTPGFSATTELGLVGYFLLLVIG